MTNEKKRILIVEDDGIVSMMLQRSLLRMGYQPEGPIASGEEAVEYCRQHIPDLLLMDIGLSGSLDGVDAVKLIHQEQEVAVIYLTALTDMRTINRAQQTNPQAFLSKPFDSSGLKASVELALYKFEMERQLRDSENRYRQLFESTPVATGVFTMDGVPIAINSAAGKLYGYTFEELQKKGGAAIAYAHPEERNALMEMAMQNGQVRDWPIEMRRKDGSTFKVLANIDMVRSGAQVVFLSTVRELPGQVTAAAPNQALMDRMQRLVEHSQDIFLFFELKPAPRLEYISPSVQAISGYTPQELQGQTMTPEFFDTPGEYTKALLMMNQAQGEVEPMVVKMKHKNGHPVWIEISGTRVRSPAGEPVAFQGVARDVTRRVQAERSLRQIEELFKNLLEQSGEAIFLADTQGGILLANRCARQMLDYTMEELQGISGFDFDSAPGGPEGRQQQIDRILKEKHMRSETSLRRKDGSTIPVALSFTLVEHQGQPAILSVAHDLTQQIKNEEQLQDALAEREALLHEIHHRVNTNLAMIAGLLGLQAESVNHPAAAHAFEANSHRMNAIAQVHQELYESPLLSRINLKLYLERMGDRLRGAIPHLPPIQLQVDVEDIFLSLETAIPLGLIANELVVNALEYAYPDDQGGEVWLSLKRLPAAVGEAPSLELMVRDRGVGLEPETNLLDGRTTGLQIVRLLVRQIQGQLQTTQTGGVCVSVRFPEAT